MLCVNVKETTLSRYTEIKNLWDVVGEKSFDSMGDMTREEMMARKLDVQLGDRLRPAISQWDQGLISSVELVDKIMWEAFYKPDVTYGLAGRLHGTVPRTTINFVFVLGVVAAGATLFVMFSLFR